jgi:tetratricopeptide (TPR) repeat protein
VSPQNAEFLLRLGASLRAQDRFEEARVALAEASRAAPRLAESARRLADLQLELGQREQAVKGLGEFLSQQPADFDAQHDLARRLEAMGQYRAARAHFESALALEPESEQVITALGLLELREGDQTRPAGAWLSARRAERQPPARPCPGSELPVELAARPRCC